MRHLLISSRSRAAAVLLVLLTACGGGDNLSVTPSAPGTPSAPDTPSAPAPTSIEVAVSTATLTVGQEARVTATLKDATGHVVSNASVTWSVDNPARATVSASGVVTALAEGVVTVTAKSSSLTGSAPITVTTGSTTPPPATTDWTFCTNAGAVCDYIGLREVRLGAADGPYVTQVAYHTVPCAAYGFDRDPAPGRSLHCDYGPIKTLTLTNPQPGMAGLPSAVVVPAGATGATGQQSAATNERPAYTDGSGSFRTTCSLATVAFDDPVVYPGQPGASHLHLFFGNTAINASSTPQSVASSGNSTCRGGTLNRTGYWMPAVFDSKTGHVVVPDEAVFYYKTGYNIDPKVVQPFPDGLRMIAGNKSATVKQDFVDWYCRDGASALTGDIPSTCRVGDAVRLAVQFPQCWDGKNLDSPDHKSHMAYPIYRNPPQVSSCPSTHPVTLPAITEHFDFPITVTGESANWRLTSDMYGSSLKGGFSAHADWMNGWDPTTMNTIVTQCLNKGVDCGVGSIGNGRYLY